MRMAECVFNDLHPFNVPRQIRRNHKEINGASVARCSLSGKTFSSNQFKPSSVLELLRSAVEIRAQDPGPIKRGKYSSHGLQNVKVPLVGDADPVDEVAACGVNPPCTSHQHV